MSDKKRHTIWIDERIWEDVLSHYKSDNCSTQNEFVENALRFYIGYLNTKNAGAFLPQAISSVMIGTMDNYAHRIASQLYKLAVEQNLSQMTVRPHESRSSSSPNWSKTSQTAKRSMSTRTT